MNKCEFSEKQFEIIINHELLNIFEYRYKCFFLSPNQYEEKEKGYDALIKCLIPAKKYRAITIQYKISDKYIHKKKLRRSLSKNDIYRFFLHKDSKDKDFKQHNKLYELTTKGISSYYVAPLFISYLDFYKHLNSHDMITNSIFIKPTTYLAKGGSHYYLYDREKHYELHSKEVIEGIGEVYNHIEEILRMVNERRCFDKDELEKMIKEVIINSNKEESDNKITLIVLEER